MRRMFVSRSSFEKPSPFERFSRTSSPSRISTFLPRSCRSGVRKLASVLLPLPESPVNQRVKPLSDMVLLLTDLAFEIRHFETLFVHDRSVPEIAHFTEQLAV